MKLYQRLLQLQEFRTIWTVFENFNFGHTIQVNGNFSLLYLLVHLSNEIEIYMSVEVQTIQALV